MADQKDQREKVLATETTEERHRREAGYTLGDVGAPTKKPASDDPEHPAATTTKDGTDVGVPMRPLAPGEKPQQGPEDAADPNSRGDYSVRGRAGRETSPRE